MKTTSVPCFSIASYTDGTIDSPNYRIAYPDEGTLRAYRLFLCLHSSGEMVNTPDPNTVYPEVVPSHALVIPSAEIIHSVIQ